MITLSRAPYISQSQNMLIGSYSVHICHIDGRVLANAPDIMSRIDRGNTCPWPCAYIPYPRRPTARSGRGLWGKKRCPKVTSFFSSRKAHPSSEHDKTCPN